MEDSGDGQPVGLWRRCRVGERVGLAIYKSLSPTLQKSSTQHSLSNTPHSFSFAVLSSFLAGLVSSLSKHTPSHHLQIVARFNPTSSPCLSDQHSSRLLPSLRLPTPTSPSPTRSPTRPTRSRLTRLPSLPSSSPARASMASRSPP